MSSETTFEVPQLTTIRSLKGPAGDGAWVPNMADQQLWLDWVDDDPENAGATTIHRVDDVILVYRPRGENTLLEIEHAKPEAVRRLIKLVQGFIRAGVGVLSLYPDGWVWSDR